MEPSPPSAAVVLNGPEVRRAANEFVRLDDGRDRGTGNSGPGPAIAREDARGGFTRGNCYTM